MNKVLNFPQKSVTYLVEITHHADGAVGAFVNDVSDSDRSTDAVWWALGQIAAKRMKADQIHAAMLARIDALMGADDGDDLAELDALADACQAYEAKAFQ